MTRRGHQRLVFWVIAASWLLGSCETVPAGPSLSNVTFAPAIESPAGWRSSQLPTIKDLRGAPDPTVCCCHVTGTITNGNSVPIHVLIRFAAIDVLSQQIGQIVFFERDLQPGVSQRIDGPPDPNHVDGAPGFLLPCRSIDHVNYQLDVSSAGPPLL